jgi:hypothetical protein
MLAMTNHGLLLGASAAVVATLALAAPASGAFDPSTATGIAPRADSLSAAFAARPNVALKKRKPRRGGTVRVGWPRKKGAPAPRSPLARWLARQAGPTPKGSSRSRARAAVANPGGVSFVGDTASSVLSLVRSFDIPTTDPAYNRLHNLSWTYDNALATLAFLDVNEKSLAEQILDQLMAVQRTDGSVDFAYDVSTGQGSAQVRSNAMAWVGIAAVRYRRDYGSTRYDPLIAGIANQLLGLRTTAGLVRGGPDVTWVSTQHNLLADAFLRDLISSLKSKSAATSLGLSVTTLTTAETKMANAILATLLVQSGSQVYFVEGVDDAKIPLDVQSFGAMFLKERNDSRASQVGSYLLANLLAPARSALSTTLSGFRPFNGSGAPNLVFTEGTIQAAVALHRVGPSTSYADSAVLSLLTTTKNGTVAPAGADQNYTANDAWGEYHTWPASAACSWVILRADGGADELFAH